MRTALLASSRDVVRSYPLFPLISSPDLPVRPPHRRTAAGGQDAPLLADGTRRCWRTGRAAAGGQADRCWRTGGPLLTDKRAAAGERERLPV